jgi:D-arabinose 1-dehydrogenase-like Zn-dependent alcohol dehydrogenase
MKIAPEITCCHINSGNVYFKSFDAWRGTPLGKTRMRVAMYYNNMDVRLEEMPTPKIGPGELLVKVLASGICGSDVMEWYRIKKAPRVLGHEIAGEIVELGKEVKKYNLGDRISSPIMFPVIVVNTV